MFNPLSGAHGGTEDFFMSPLGEMIGGFSMCLRLGGYMVESNQGHVGDDVDPRAGDARSHPEVAARALPQLPVRTRQQVLEIGAIRAQLPVCKAQRGIAALGGAPRRRHRTGRDIEGVARFH